MTKILKLLFILFVSFLIIILLSGFLSRVKLKNHRQAKLNELKTELSLQQVYPGAVELLRVENPERYLQFYLSGAHVRLIYGSNDEPQKIEEFYRNELESLGWSYIGTGSEKLYRYRRLTFHKDEMSLDLGFWYPEDFKIQFPDLDSNFKTLYEISMLRNTSD